MKDRLTDKVPARKNASKSELDLQDLDELSPGLGEKIEELIKEIIDLWDVNEAEETINQSLTAEGLTMADVFVERGIDKGYNLKIVFEALHYNCMLQDRLRG